MQQFHGQTLIKFKKNYVQRLSIESQLTTTESTYNWHTGQLKGLDLKNTKNLTKMWVGAPKTVGGHKKYKVLQLG